MCIYISIPKCIYVCMYAAAKSLQSCPTLCDPRDGSPPGSPVRGILQARTLEWGAISFSNACKWKVKVKSLSHVWLLATQWTAAYQAPPSMGVSRQEYWSGVPLPSPNVYVCVCVCVCERERELLSNVWLFVTPWTVAHQVPFSEGFSRQEYWSGLPFPSPKMLMKVCKIKMVTVLSSTVTRKHLWDLRKYYLLRSSCFGLS